MNKIIKIFLLGIEGIFTHKLRSFLSMLGVTVGVFSVIMLVSLGEGSKKQIEKEFSGFGTNLIFVTPGKIDPTQPQMFNPAQVFETSTLTENDVTVIESIEAIKYTTPIDIIGGSVSFQNKPSPQSFTLSVYPEFFSIRESSLLEGRLFTREEIGKKEIVCVLGINTKKEFFGEESAVGKKIIIKDVPIKVVGVLDKSPVAFRMFGFDFDSVVYVPFGTSQIISSRPPQIFRILVQAKEEKEIGRVAEEIKNSLKETREGREDFSVLRQEDILKILNSILNILIAFISAIAGISLFVGGIGIMNIMLVSVNERVKEVGLRKAVGARKSDILFQFLTEAVLITLFGGGLGITGAFFLSEIISQFTAFAPVITFKYLILALGVAFFVGVIFGTAPAIKAANLDPIEALRHE